MSPMNWIPVQNSSRDTFKFPGFVLNPGALSWLRVRSSTLLPLTVRARDEPYDSLARQLGQIGQIGAVRSL